jgi:hypothetical protein
LETMRDLDWRIFMRRSGVWEITVLLGKVRIDGDLGGWKDGWRIECVVIDGADCVTLNAFYVSVNRTVSGGATMKDDGDLAGFSRVFIGVEADCQVWEVLVVSWQRLVGHLQKKGGWIFKDLL